MLFNSFEFILVFLPGTLLLYFLMLHWRLTIAAKSWLLFASLCFYSWWNVKYLPLILVSILFNYTVGGLLADYDGAARTIIPKRWIFTGGVTANVILLCYFKYMDFFIANLNTAFTVNLPFLHIILPLGISFFTITQIAFLVDAYEGLVEERNLLNYALFVTFFPHLLAGPILHHKDMMPQFDRLRNKVVNWKNLYLGISLFLLGLFKKVVIADQFAVWATSGFDTPQSLNFFAAWFASLSYTFQLYFDFSGYSDMAVGIGWMFNINLPINFNSPYKATSVIDFWKRWHITLTNFVTTYLYTPILRSFGRITFAGSMVAIFASMLISGFWHGAGWMFVVWGGMHGAALVTNHVWRRNKLRMPHFMAWLITFNFVNIAFVFFRAKTWANASNILEGMAGLHGVMLHKSLQKFHFIQDTGIHFGLWLDAIKGNDRTYFMIIVALLVTVFVRNSVQITPWFKPNWRSFAFMVTLALWTLVNMGKVSEFLYFQF